MNYYKVKVKTFNTSGGMSYEYGDDESGFPVLVIRCDNSEWGVSKSHDSITESSNVIKITETVFNELLSTINTDNKIEKEKQEKLTLNTVEEIDTIKAMIAELGLSIGGGL